MITVNGKLDMPSLQLIDLINFLTIHDHPDTDVNKYGNESRPE